MVLDSEFYWIWLYFWVVCVLFVLWYYLGWDAGMGNFAGWCVCSVGVYFGLDVCVCVMWLTEFDLRVV